MYVSPFLSSFLSFRLSLYLSSLSLFAGWWTTLAISDFRMFSLPLSFSVSVSLPFPTSFFRFFLSFLSSLSLTFSLLWEAPGGMHAFLPLPIPEKQTMCKGGRKEEEVVVGLEEEEEGKVEGTPSTSSLLSQRSCQKYNERVKRERRRYSERGEGGRGRGGKGGMPFFLHLPPGTF